MNVREALEFVIANADARHGGPDDNPCPWHAHREPGIWDDDTINNQTAQKGAAKKEKE